MLKKISLLMYALCFAFSLLIVWDTPCQAGWVKSYGGLELESAFAVEQTSDSGYIVAGQTLTFGPGESAAWLVKLDADGEIMWQKAYGGTGYDYAWSVQQTNDGGYIMLGGSETFGAGGTDIWLVKLEPDGDVVWQKTFGGTSNESVYWVQQTSDDGYIVLGDTYSFGAGDRDVWILKLNADGDVTWQKTYGGTGYDLPFSIQQTTPDGGYILAGGTSSFGAGSSDLWLVKLDADGKITWQKAYGGTGYDFANSVMQTTDGGYIVAGQTSSFGAGKDDVWVMKITNSGDVTWQKTYGGTESELAFSIQQTNPDGGYIMTGGTYSFGTGNNDLWLVKLDADGEVTWQKTYGGSGSEGAYLVRQTNDGSYVAAGRTNSFSSGSYDAWILKVDGNGSASPCPFEGISTAIVSDTAATITETAAVTGNTSAVGVNTTVVPVDSTATTTVVCPLTGDIQLKVGSTRKRQGYGTVTTADGLIDCPGTCQGFYPAGFDVTLYANPAILSTFIGWKPTPLGCEATNPICKITMDEKKKFKAIFQGPNKLKVGTTFKKGALGSVISGDGLINCPTDCDESYILNAPVTLTANAGTDSRFVKWTGQPCKEVLTNVCTFNMEKNVKVKAIFEPLD